jgi:hypothetical protein
MISKRKYRCKSDQKMPFLSKKPSNAKSDVSPIP